MVERLLSGFIVLLVTDFFIYQLIARLKYHSPGSRFPAVFKFLQHILILGLLIFSIVWTIRHPSVENDPVSYRNHFTFTAVFAFLYIPKIILVVFYICGELLIFIRRLNHTLFHPDRSLSALVRFHIRRTFALAGVIIALITLYFIARGILFTRSDFRLREVHVYSPDLPPSFEGFRIVQLSDMHLGSWTRPKDVEKGLLLARAAKPDLLCLTGDLINVNAAETKPYLKDFSELNAPFGKVAVLGNHDMGDYARFGSRDSSGTDIQRISQFYEQCGFQLLRNRNIRINKGTDSIAVIGIDNWGKKKFRRYGKLNKAVQGCETMDFTLLLSHDPTHWREEVLTKKFIDLTLSGHTHGMQMALEINDLRLSPASLIYRYWAGLFREGNQFLHVNPGFGFLGFPGRIGLRPEISLIILHRQ